VLWQDLGKAGLDAITLGDPTPMTQPATTIQGSGPLMQFSARVGRSNACVRVQKGRLEWATVGRQWLIQMAPMTSITAVTANPGPLKTNLVITTAVGTAEFLVDQEIAERARDLLTRLIEASTSPLDGANEADLINLKWKLDTQVVDPANFEEGPRRLLGY
jgi:hypothetical protein